MGIFSRATNILRRATLRALFPAGIKPHDMDRQLAHILPRMAGVRHQFLCFRRSQDDSDGLPPRLLDIATRAIAAANASRPALLERRINETAHVPELRDSLATGFNPLSWPGEHYRLLPAIASCIGAKSIVEIGTHWGLGALALAEGLADGGKEGGTVTTYDIAPWNSYEATVLREEDFKGPLRQVIGNLADPDFFETQRETIENADLIFMDAAKDGDNEKKFLAAFAGCRFRKPAILLVDDIHMWTMPEIWATIPWPKMDLTSFGHYTGTGLVELPHEGGE